MSNKIIIVFSFVFLLIFTFLLSQSELAPQIVCQKDGAQMVLVPEGEFIYGIKKTNRSSILINLPVDQTNFFETEFSEQAIQIPAFYIDVYEVTNEQYLKFCSETRHRYPNYINNQRWNHPRQPVVGIGWKDAEAYAKWAGKRLPTEREWEKAARGPNGNIWPWGDIPQSDCFNGKAAGFWATTVVGSFPNGKSYYGVMDMAGNVWEMTSDFWLEASHAMRGGSYLNSIAYVRTMVRWAMNDELDGATWLGFRCVKDID
jgi:formylglycine-generating enzyme required for sulfatase activity